MDPNWCKGFGGTSDDPASCMELASLRGVISFGFFRFRCRFGTGILVIVSSLELGWLEIVVEKGVIT